MDRIQACAQESATDHFKQVSFLSCTYKTVACYHGYQWVYSSLVVVFNLRPELVHQQSFLHNELYGSMTLQLYEPTFLHNELYWSLYNNPSYSRILIGSRL